jgi:hypothetical protein
MEKSTNDRDRDDVSDVLRVHQRLELVPVMRPKNQNNKLSEHYLQYCEEKWK